MHYLSTRNNKLKKSFLHILFQGLSQEGGLFLPDTWPLISTDSLRGKNYQEVAPKIVIFLFEFSITCENKFPKNCNA